MENSPEETSVATIALLEARLRRVEHVLYGPPKNADLWARPAVESLAELERQFASLISGVRVYAELLKIYRAYPSFFQPPHPGLPPTQLDSDAIRATVLSYASAFPATASALSAALNDTPVPEAALSAQLVGLVPRMETIDASQRALEAEIAQLRSRSERLVRQHYERRALASSKQVANVEARFQRMEGRVRRLEKEQRATAEE
ncbi:nuclear distribution protein [Grosmannia clavigera kw1407]|uniref:Nuclear distribution protein n=1 Tax=Grosmannia clavigera (strain kw1407 / UAMH 11150) TaxID=655863 RepID=F0XKA3_GROCL|nr:nuclear distribution protein [Grosmannia clavigera kw1407]EFX01855.1 nuclear distribution protein [Grosmannia clavigera kw1407]